MLKLANLALALGLLAPSFADGITIEHRLIHDGSTWGDRPVAFDGVLVATGGPSPVRVFEGASGNLVRELHYKWEWGETLHWEDFGRCVDIDGDHVVVGAPNDHDGAAYVYSVSTGSMITRLWPEAYGLGDGFGSSVAIEGGLVLVGAPDDSTTAFQAGAVHVFEVTTGKRLAKLVVPSGREDRFGSAINIDAGRSLVGAPGADPDPPGSRGAAYLFDLETYELLQEFRATDGLGSKSFGSDVALEGDRALIGDPSFGTQVRGVVHLFDLDGGTSVRLKAGEAIPGNSFGWSVALSGGISLIGARDDDGSGALYVFDALGRRVGRYDPPDGQAGDYFGLHLAASGDRLVVGGELEHPYVLSLFSPTGQSYCGPAVRNSTGASGQLEVLGSPLADAQYLWLSATQLPPAAPTMFLTSRTQGFTAPPGAQGNLCLGGSLGVYSDQLIDAVSGSAMISLDLDETPTPAGPVAIQPGETWNFQAWYRDRDPGPTTNFTDAVSVTFN